MKCGSFQSEALHSPWSHCLQIKHVSLHTSFLWHTTDCLILFCFFKFELSMFSTYAGKCRPIKCNLLFSLSPLPCLLEVVVLVYFTTISVTSISLNFRGVNLSLSSKCIGMIWALNTLWFTKWWKTFLYHFLTLYLWIS